MKGINAHQKFITIEAQENPNVRNSNFTPIKMSIIQAMISGLFFLSPFMVNAQPLLQPQSYVTATQQSAQALTNQSVILFSYHFAFIFNNNYFRNPYTTTFTLCPMDQACTTKTQVNYLEPHQSINIKWVMTNTVLYTSPGLYSIVAMSTITGSDVNVTVSDVSSINVISPYSENFGQLNA